MSGNVEVVTIITPKPGKIENVIEKMTPYSDWVEANEPGCLRYEIFRQVNGGVEVLVILETFKDKQAREAHSTSTEHLELLKGAAEEGLLASAPDIKEVKHASGFGLRG